MLRYAVLGATGSTGSAITRYLHERADKVDINVYARSASKLQQVHPFIQDASNIHAFVGELSNTELLRACLQNVHAVFCTVAQNVNEPGCSIAQQTAHAIVNALDSLRKAEGDAFTCPYVIFLSSATLNPILIRSLPGTPLSFVRRAMYHVYADLHNAIDYIEEQKWIPLACIEPGALVHDASRGWELSETEITGLISYDDLGRAMVQMAEDDGGQKWARKRVGVKATGYVRPYIWPLVKFELSGILAYFLPSLWRLGYGTLW